MSYTTLSAPITCQIELTSACNNNCKHCYNFWRSTDCATRTLGTQEIKTIIRKLSNSRVFDIVITGGEPLMAFKSLVECIQDAKEAGMGVYLNSNLVPLTRERAKILKSLGVSYILTSVMGSNAAIHNSIAQRAGAFERVVENIRLAQEEGIGVVANMVVSKLNLGDVKNTGRLVHSLGVSKFTATKAGCPGNCPDFSEMSLDLSEFRQYLGDLCEVGKELGIEIDALEGYPLCGVKDLDLHNWIVGRKCLAGVTSMTIASDGSVRPCSHMDEACGNLLEEDLPDIWLRMGSWRSCDNLPSTCKSCKLFGVCGGGCRMEAKMHGGHINDSDPYCSSDDVAFSASSLKAHQMKKKEENADLVSSKSIKVLQHRIRREPFGATAIGKSRFPAFLNQEGSEILSSLSVGATYKINDARISWGSVNSMQFITELVHKGVLELT